MQSIGNKLQETRERLGISLEEVERGTRIRTHHLEAIERGDFEMLPSAVQARGFLRNYAEFLGLEASSLLLDYADKIQSRHAKREGAAYQEPQTRPSVEVRSRRSRWLSADVIVAAGITLAILTVLVWGGSRIMSSLRESSSAGNLANGFLISTLTPTPEQVESSPVVSEPVAVSEPTLADPIPTTILILPSSQVNIRLVVEIRTWLRVTVDGEEQFRGRLKAGEILNLNAENIIEISTGNAAGVRIFFNEQDQGLLGELGQVVTRLWTIEGPITPTPTQTPPPTVTPTVTDTPIASLTPTPTSGNGE